MDAPAIVKIIGYVWAEYGCVLDTSIEEKYLFTPEQYFHARNGEFWVVDDAGEIIATVAVMTNDEEIAELKSLYVNARFRGVGLGERLTQHAMDFARKGGAREKILWSDTRFTDAHRHYERLGFERTGIRELNDLNNSVEYGYRISLEG